MALRNILTQEDPVLRKRSREVTDFGARTAALLDDLKETLEQANGLGLASPQVGMLRRAVVILKDDDYVELVNPEIIEQHGEVDTTEACLSCPDLIGYVKRPQKVRVKAQDRSGELFELELEDMLARAACHEIDHLDGVLFIDRVHRFVTAEELAEEEEKEREEALAQQEQNEQGEQSAPKE